MFGKVPCLLQEVRLSPDPAATSSIVHINASDSSTLFGAGRKRTHDEISGLDKEGYARKHLALESSIFFRQRDAKPRNILWRVLDDRQLLELQSVDLVQTKQHAKHESCLTFHISLSAAIIPGGVALADSQSNDALEVFMVTTANELYTVTLKRDLLLRDSPPKEFDPTTCIRKHALSSLSFHRPYKLVAVSGTQLLISLHDGGVLRIERDRAGANAAWKETFFTEGGWTGTLRGLIPLKRHQTVRFGELDLEPSAAVALAQSPDGQHIWTVSLDHELCAWSTRTGKVVARQDLMGARQDLDDRSNASQYLMQAEQQSILQVLAPADTVDDGTDDQLAATTRQYQIVAYSPKERAFRLLFARPGATADDPPRVHDVMQGVKLNLPFDDLLNTNLWRCTGFQCKVDPLWQVLQLWVGVQSGALTELFTLTINLFDQGELVDGWERKWQSAWTIVARPDTRHTAATPAPGLQDLTMLTKQWLDFILYPGRFTQASLEVALHSYLQPRNFPSSMQKPKPSRSTSKALKGSQHSFADRLSSSITSNVLLDQKGYKAYYERLQGQWQGFYAILLDLQSMELEVLGFALDRENELPWILHADVVAPVRALSTLEGFLLNQGLDVEEEIDNVDEATRDRVVKTEDDWDNLRFLAAVQSFADSLPKPYRQYFATKAVAAAVNSSPMQGRAYEFFKQMDVGEHISDEAYQALEFNLEPLNGIGGLANSNFLGLMQVAETFGQRGVKSDLALNRYGSKLMIAAAQSFIKQDKALLLDLLTLVAFVHNDFEVRALHDDFNAVKLFEEIIVALRHAELRDWLTRNVCLEPSRKQLILSTVFETLFIGDWDDHAPKALSYAQKLTHWSRQWAFAKFSDWHGFTTNIFATLLRYKMYDLASDFERFLFRSAWAQYLQARLLLALGDYEQAAEAFEAASNALSKPQTKGDLDTAGFLTSEELSHLSQGREMYKLHIANLFEQARQYAYTADFAQAALMYIDEAELESDFELIDGRKRSTQSPVEHVANARAEVKLLKTRTTWEEIVSRLFNALVQTGRFQEAFTALNKFKTPELQKSNLQKLIDSCVKNDMLETVLELPLDESAAKTADAILLKLAKKAAGSGRKMRPAQQTLYAFRTRRANYRGAAEVLYEHLERLRHHDRKRHDPDDETLLQAYLILINTLACCGEGEGWLLAQPIEGVHGAETRRKLITLEDVRREYVAELDRRSDLQHGRFPLIGGVDDDNDDEMDVL